ncbi:MAG: diguanylate cyclase, partial [Thermoanaerobaculia bacterium]|nr:diguanylate cyclase [Thermoanaerobaculia bacterium]
TLLPDTDAAGAEIVAERLRRAVEADAFYDVPRFAADEGGEAESIRLQVTISVGIATAVRPASPKPDEVVRRADAALYEAKASGKNRVVSHRPGEDPVA